MIPANWAERPVLQVPEVGELFGLSERSVRRGIEAGEIPSIRIGRRVVVPVAPVLAMLGITS